MYIPFPGVPDSRSPVSDASDATRATLASRNEVSPVLRTNLMSEARLPTSPITCRQGHVTQIMELPPAIRVLRQLWAPNHIFSNGSLWYDLKANPASHLRAMWNIARLCDERNYRGFSPFPLRKSWIPNHITIDTKIMAEKILRVGLGARKYEHWQDAISGFSKRYRKQTKRSRRARQPRRKNAGRKGRSKTRVSLTSTLAKVALIDTDDQSMETSEEGIDKMFF